MSVGLAVEIPHGPRQDIRKRGKAWTWRHHPAGRDKASAWLHQCPSMGRYVSEGVHLDLRLRPLLGCCRRHVAFGSGARLERPTHLRLPGSIQKDSVRIIWCSVLPMDLLAITRETLVLKKSHNPRDLGLLRRHVIRPNAIEANQDPFSCLLAGGCRFVADRCRLSENAGLRLCSY